MTHPTGNLTAAGADTFAALNSGYRAFAIAAACAATAALIGAMLLPAGGADKLPAW